MFVHLKQSGELLASGGEDGALWTPEGVRASTEKVATTWRHRKALGMRGLLLVSGAGNIIRGEKLMQQGIANGYADTLGRLGTIQNTLVLAAALAERGVAVRPMIAGNMMLRDVSLDEGVLEPYSFEGALDAYDREEVILVAGGTGEDNKTTDNAVLAYAAEHGRNNPDDEIVVLKGTKFDGVYEDDPAKNGRARRFASITAGYMLKEYDRFAAVDVSALETINQTGVAMRVYRDNNHDLTQVIGDSSNEIGTLIIPGDAEHEPVLAD